MPQILCKHCGTPNAPERMVCIFCHQPLHVVDDEGESIRPGDVPTKKSTGELEPILPEWLRDARENARRAEDEKTAEEAASMGTEPAKGEGLPDLLAGLESVSRDDQDYDVPDWLNKASSAPKPGKDEAKFPRRQELNWGDDDELGGMATPPIASAPESGDAMLPWMRDLEQTPAEEKDVQPSTSQEMPAVSPFASGTFKPPATGELTDWLDKASSELQAGPAPAGSGSDDSLGEWLSNLPPVESTSETLETGGIIQDDVDLPDWMKPVPEPESRKQEPAGEVPLPDWMASFREKVASGEQKPAPEQPAPELPSAPAFSDDSLTSEQTSDLFSEEMPDWLSNIAPAAPAEPVVPVVRKPESAPVPEETPQELISPADLPSWVQAMRPVETILPDAEAVLPQVDGPVEKEGPLAGLQGVLPLAGELFQPGRSKAQALLLQVSDAQQADASLLEKMLASETEAEPLRGGGMLVSQRVLRWVLSALLIGLISFFIAARLQSVPLPASLPDESWQVLPVLEALPAEAPVLMIFDYEPALAGELEAAAAPFVDHLLGLRRPRLTLLSTSPTGGALAERFFKNTQSQHDYQLDRDYINLGYLPGGTIGILSFAENPRLALPLPAWDQPPAQAVKHLSDYAAILLLTDSAGSARAWVEQTTNRRQDVPMLVVSSAQAAPMIQPYLLSGQVNGLVSGLLGGAAFEGTDQSGAYTRGVWDAFNYATLLAAALMVLGGLWNLIAGARARRRALDEV